MMWCKAKIWLALCLGMGLLFMIPGVSDALRIKDIGKINGVRGNQLIGYGLVVGLKGTGDKKQTKFTAQSLVNMLERLGISVKPGEMRVKNVAAVIVTVDLPPFARAGTRLDALVSSLGDAKSLLGGTLLLTPLKAPDGQVYAVAQGPISVGGFAFGGAAGGGTQVNHPTVGRVLSGAIVEREVPMDFNSRKILSIALHHPDFTTALRVATRINQSFQRPIASALDGGTIRIHIPQGYLGKATELVAKIETLEVVTDAPAKIILDERTGTVVIGQHVKVSMVAVSHGNLSIVIKERPQVSQPLPFSPQSTPGGGAIVTEEGVTIAPGGQTVVTPDTEVTTEEEKVNLVIIPESVSIGDLVRALNALGASPRELIMILQAIKAAGALHADLEII